MWLNDGSRGHRLDIASLVRRQPPRIHLCVCGPGGMIAEAIDVALSSGWDKHRIHFERFGAPRHADDHPFEVQCRRSKRTLTVLPGVTLLETLEQAGIEVPFACRAGSCGACETVVLEGDVEHRDSTMTDTDRGRPVAR